MRVSNKWWKFLRWRHTMKIKICIAISIIIIFFYCYSKNLLLYYVSQSLFPTDIHLRFQCYLKTFPNASYYIWCGWKFIWMILIWINPLCPKASKYFSTKRKQCNFTLYFVCECNMRASWDFNYILQNKCVHRALFPFAVAKVEFKPFDLYFSW